MTNSELLRQEIENSGYKLQYLAGKLEITRFALSNKINNLSEFKASEIATLCKELKIDDPDKRDAIFFNN
ncbi:hypothetical protein MASR2M70_10870 [Bacillota bacterium]